MKRFWIVFWTLISQTKKGGGPIGVTSDNGKYLNCESCRKEIGEILNISPDSIMVTNFKEVNEEEFNEFNK